MKQFSSDYFYFLSEIKIPGHQLLVKMEGWKRWCWMFEKNGEEPVISESR